MNYMQMQFILQCHLSIYCVRRCPRQKWTYTSRKTLRDTPEGIEFFVPIFDFCINLYLSKVIGKYKYKIGSQAIVQSSVRAAHYIETLALAKG